jgi:hypothetical protein
VSRYSEEFWEALRAVSWGKRFSKEEAEIPIREIGLRAKASADPLREEKQ